MLLKSKAGKETAMLWQIQGVVSKGKYNYAKVPGHPHATRKNYVLEHRIVMENKLGRLLLPEEVVHHINGNQKDNRIENLEVLTHKEHTRLHSLQQGKNWVLLECPHCQRRFLLPKNKLNYGPVRACSKACGRRFFLFCRNSANRKEADKRIAANRVKHFVYKRTAIEPLIPRMLTG